MKFKVGQKVRVVENDCNARKGDTGIVKGKSSEFDKDHLYAVEFPRFEAGRDGHDCDGLVPSDKGQWTYEDAMEPLISFQEKLDRFLKEPVGFLVKSKEIADELVKVFERNHMKTRGDLETVAGSMDRMWKLRGIKTYVTYNYRKDEHELSYGISDSTGETLELLDVTLDELKEYLESSPQTLEDKLELFKAGTHVLHTPTQEIYDKLMEELEKRGYVWATEGKPTELKGYWENNTAIQCNYYGDGRIVMRKIKYVERDGLGIIELTLEDINSSKQEDHMKITIETDGHHKTTAECNGVTAESLCNPTDDFKLPKGVHMAVQRLLEKLEEDTGFHVGDIVEVVANEFGFSGNPVGLQGIVEWGNGHGANVKLPTRDEPLIFYNRELKLIRRGNN